MARSGSSIETRIALTGGDAVKRELEALGKAGERSLKDLGTAAGDAGKSLGGVSSGGAEIGDAFFRVNREVTLFRKGLNKSLAIGVLGAATAALRFAGGVAEADKSMKDLERSTGASGRDLAALKLAFRAAGADGDLAATVAGSLGNAFHQARLTSDELQKSLGGGVNLLKGTAAAATEAAKGVAVLRGNMQGTPSLKAQLMGPAVLRGGAQPAEVKVPTDAAGALKALEIKPPAAGASPEAQVAKWREVTKALIEMKAVNADIAEELAKLLLGTDHWRESLDGLEAAFKTGNWETFTAAVKNLGLVMGPEERKKAEDYRKAVGDLSSAWEGLKTQAGASLFPSLTSGIEATSSSLRDATSTGQAFGNLLRSLGQAVIEGNLTGLAAGLQAAAAPLVSLGGQIFDAWLERTRAAFNQAPGIAASAFAAVGQIAQNAMLGIGQSVQAEATALSGIDWSRAFQGLANAAAGAAAQARGVLSDLWSFAKSVGSDLLRTTAAAGAAGALPLGMATGGVVPGSGRGDRVRALLEPGEFVLQRSIVAALGLSFLTALNGGTLMPPDPGRFALGGLVAPAASGGGAKTPIMQVIGGERVALEADDRAAASVQRVARRRAMLSAGAAPGAV